jgi:hypothetical protein
LVLPLGARRQGAQSLDLHSTRNFNAKTMSEAIGAAAVG